MRRRRRAAREWRLSGALGTASGRAETAVRVDAPFGGKAGGVTSSGHPPRRVGLTIISLIVSLIRSLDPLKTPVGQRYKQGEE